MDIEMMLYEIKYINDKYDLINKRTGGYFNIFTIANISSNEVIICRVIQELLSPSGKHYQGNLYLRSFIKEVLKIDMGKNEIDTAKVYKEYKTEEGRRIDLVIKTNNNFIPIEVKIYAGEQKDQCVDYYRDAKNSKLYYLTRFGDLPSDYSALGVVENITPISFEHDILNWLDICLKEKETIKIAPIREIILQLSSTIRCFTNKEEDEKAMDIRDIIVKSSDYIRSAHAISNEIAQCKKDMMKKLLVAIEEGINKEIQATGVHKIIKLDNEYDYAYSNYSKIETYYDKKESTWPAISYLYKKDEKPGVDLWVRIEIDHRVFIGYCAVENNKPINGDNKNKFFSKVENKSNDWWLKYDYINENTTSEAPNFKEPNEALFQLFDDNKFNSYVNECVNIFLQYTEKSHYILTSSSSRY